MIRLETLVELKFIHLSFSSSNLSNRAVRADPRIETRQTVPRRAIRGNGISVNGTPPPLKDAVRFLEGDMFEVDVSRAITDGIGTPDPDPKHLVDLGFLLEVSKSYICLNWLSGALVGVGGSDFIRIGHARLRRLAVLHGAQ